MAIEQMTVTDCPAGRGFDPTAAGYQIKACSPGLTPEERLKLKRISERYGEAVYADAPRAARAREDDWRQQGAGYVAFPSEVLREFPVIWSYDQLSEERFALTRVGYAGWTHDNRTGSFFAHSLVFAPEILEAVRWNPLALARAGLFESRDTSEQTSLPALPDSGVGTAAAGAPNQRILLNAPYDDQLEAMLSALCTASPATRPMLVCLPEWRPGGSLIEVLLELLPPAARCRTTFSTYESKRDWLPPGPTGERPTGMNAPHHLAAFYGGEGISLRLLPHEYQAKFALFNLVDHKHSDNIPARRYASFAASCLRDGRLARLAEHHMLTQRLEAGRDIDAWDKLIPAVGVLDPSLDPQELLAAAEALLSVGTAEAIPEVRDLAFSAIKESRARTAGALLKAFGQAREAVLLAALKQVLDTPEATLAPAPAPDRAALTDLLLAGVAAAQKAPETGPPLEWLLVACFSAAREAARLPEVWATCGNSVVKPLLAGEWTAQTRPLARKLEAILTPEEGPDGNAYLNLKLLEAGGLAEAQFIAGLDKVARASPRCSDPTKVAAELVRIARARFKDPPQRTAEVLGRLAEMAEQQVGGPSTLFQAYREESDGLEGRQHEVRRKLADEGVTHILCREMIEELLPWEEKESADKFRSNWAPLLKTRGKLTDTARAEVARRLPGMRTPEGEFPLAERLLPDPQDRSATEPGAIALYDALALALPLRPLSDKWRQRLPHIPGGLSRLAAARLGLMRFMREVEEASGRDTWSILEFPHTRPEWRNVRELEPEEKQKALKWCVHTLDCVGLSAPEEAGGLLAVLEAAGKRTAEDAADAIEELLEGRDPVSAVILATAFARGALEGSRSARDWSGVLKAILERFDRETRKLLREHLEHRFSRRDVGYAFRLEDLYRDLGWPAPKAAAKPRAAAEGAVEGGSEPGIVEKAWGWLKRARGGSGEPPRSGDR
jgi:hypothetical protein